MGLFDRAEKKAQKAEQERIQELPWVAHPATIDRTLGDALVAGYLQACRSADWHAARAHLADASPAQAARAVAVVDEMSGPNPMFDQWIEATPDDSLAWVARAQHRVAHGWEVRGGGYAETVDDGAWDTFHDLLRGAFDDGLRAIDLAPDSPLPYPPMLWASLGLGTPKEELIGLFDRSHDRLPFFPATCRAVLQGLAPKWSGSEEQLFAVATMAREECPSAHSQHGLIAQAHLEMQLAAWSDGLTDPTHMQRSDVRAAVTAAANASIFDAGFVDDGDGLEMINVFAFCFYLQDDRDAVHRTMAMLDGRFYDYPWYYLGDPGRLVAKCCALNEWTGPGAPPT